MNEEALFNRLHELVGICGCCGKHDCAGRQSNSQLPDNIRLDTLLKAVNFTRDLLIEDDAKRFRFLVETRSAFYCTGHWFVTRPIKTATPDAANGHEARCTVDDAMRELL